jgi:hypothetical protein
MVDIHNFSIDYMHNRMMFTIFILKIQQNFFNSTSINPEVLILQHFEESSFKAGSFAFSQKQNRQYMYNITLRHLHIAIVGVEKQWVYIFCSL